LSLRHATMLANAETTRTGTMQRLVFEIMFGGLVHFALIHNAEGE
jgi:hypothetical protein